MSLSSDHWRADPAARSVWRVDLCLNPSRFFLGLTTALHLAALMALLEADIAWWWRLPLGGWVLASVVSSWRAACAEAGVVVREQVGRWWVETPRHAGAAELVGCQVWRYLVVMRFRGRDAEGRVWRCRVVVWPDSVSADAFRRLRVRLRYGLLRQQKEGMA